MDTQKQAGSTLYERLLDALDKETELRGVASDSLLEALPWDNGVDFASDEQPGTLAFGGGCASDTLLAPPLTNRGSKDVSNNNTARGKSTLNGVFENIEFYGGFDGGCEVGFDGYWLDGKDKAILKYLDESKTLARDKETQTDVYVELGGIDWLISPKSTNGNVTYAYQISSSGVTLLIHNNPGDGIQPVRVHYGFESLDRTDLQQLHRGIKRYLSRLGFYVGRERVSRCDIHLTATVDPQLLLKPISQGKYCCRAKSPKIFGRPGRLETFLTGNAIQLCIYDKGLELTSSRDHYKFECIYGRFSDVPEYLTRIEYRLKREALKAFGLDTVDLIYKHLPGIVNYLTVSWFRIFQAVRSDGNENRRSLNPTWLKLIECFRLAFDSDGLTGLSRIPEYMKTGFDEQTYKQALGCLTTAPTFYLIRLSRLIGRIVIKRMRIRILTTGNITKFHTIQAASREYAYTV